MKKRGHYSVFFFCTPALGTAFDLLTIEATATAAEGIMERFKRLQPAASSWSTELGGSDGEEKLEMLGEPLHSMLPEA